MLVLLYEAVAGVSCLYRLSLCCFSGHVQCAEGLLATLQDQFGPAQCVSAWNDCNDNATSVVIFFGN